MLHKLVQDDDPRHEDILAVHRDLRIGRLPIYISFRSPRVRESMLEL